MKLPSARRKGLSGRTCKAAQRAAALGGGWRRQGEQAAARELEGSLMACLSCHQPVGKAAARQGAGPGRARAGLRAGAAQLTLQPALYTRLALSYV